MTLIAGDTEGDGEARQGMLSSNRLPDFRVSLGKFVRRDETNLVVPEDVLDALKLKPGAPARVWMRSK